MRNFVRSPLPTLTVWIGDGLSALGLNLYGRGLEWRIKRQASHHATEWAILDALLLTVAGALIWRAV